MSLFGPFVRAALVSALSLAAAPSASGQATTYRPSDARKLAVSRQGRDACFALRKVGLMPKDSEIPEGTRELAVGSPWRQRPERSSAGVFVQEQNMEPDAAGIRESYNLRIFPTDELAQEDLRIRTTWSTKLVYTPFDAGGDEALASGAAPEVFFRCGNVVVSLNLAIKLPATKDDAGVARNRERLRAFNQSGNPRLMEQVRQLHAALREKGACGCRARGGKPLPAEPSIGVKVSLATTEVMVNAPVRGTAIITLSGLGGPLPLRVRGALVDTNGRENATRNIVLQGRGNGTHKIALTQDLGLRALVETPGDYSVVVECGSVNIGRFRGEGSAACRVTRSGRKVLLAFVSGGNASGNRSVRPGSRVVLPIVCSVQNQSSERAQVSVRHAFSITGPEDHEFDPAEDTCNLAAGANKELRFDLPVTFRVGGLYQIHYRLEARDAEPVSGRAMLVVETPLTRRRGGKPPSKPIAKGVGGPAKPTDGARPATEADATAARAKSLAAAGKQAEAEAVLREAVRLDPTRDACWSALADLCIVQRNWTEAEQALAEATALKPSKWEYMAAMAKVQHEQGRKADAIAAAREALRLGMPKSAPILGVLGIKP